MSKFKLFLAAVLLLFALDVGFAIPMAKTAASPQNLSQSDKYDGDCTGSETIGRCGDKCPQGSYEIGRAYDGAPICHLEPTGCPYGDAIPLDSPKCAPSKEELEHQQVNETIQTVDIPPADVNDFEGK